MRYPVTMSVQVVQTDEGHQPYAWVSVGEAQPGPIRISLELPLGAFDNPENLQDYARQALAQVCEAL